MDIVLKSHLVRSGSPALYQLRPKTEITGGVKRVTLGQKDVNKINKTVLLVGETGTGKTTLINALVNYAMGVKWEDDVWFECVEDEKRSQSESQTSDVIVYQIFGFEGKTLPFSLTIVDTPGYGNTRGTERDVITSLRLLELLRSGDRVNEISAVGLVLKASDNRLSDRLRYVFDSVVSLLGKDFRNIVPLITHSDGGPPDNVLKALEESTLRCVRNSANLPLYFLFNNRQSTQKTGRYQIFLKFAWDLTTEQIAQFIDFLTHAEPQKLHTNR